jgi:hypothetical protein
MKMENFGRDLLVALIAQFIVIHSLDLGMVLYIWCDPRWCEPSLLLVLCCAYKCNLRWDIFLVQCWLLQHTTPFSARHVEHHVGFTLPSLSLQGVGCVCLGPTKGIPLWFLNSTHEYKIWVRFGNVWIACHSMRPLLEINSKKFEKSTQSKFSYVVYV